jgi:hypothetical protein
MPPGSEPRSPVDDVQALVGHPRGTLAIVLTFGALFAAGWFAMFLWLFMERGAPHAH